MWSAFLTALNWAKMVAREILKDWREELRDPVAVVLLVGGCGAVVFLLWVLDALGVSM